MSTALSLPVPADAAVETHAGLHLVPAVTGFAGVARSIEAASAPPAYDGQSGCPTELSPAASSDERDPVPVAFADAAVSVAALREEIRRAGKRLTILHSGVLLLLLLALIVQDAFFLPQHKGTRYT